jgi:DNA-binding LacI/PurR family transcriptional regulator
MIRKPIRTGQYSAGDKIPSESEFIEKYNVSRITVRRAFQELITEGLIEGRKGQGTFVRAEAGHLAAHRYMFIHAQGVQVTYPFTQRILNGIQSMTPNHKFRLEIMAVPYVEHRDIKDTSASDIIELCKFNGVITLSGLMNHEELRRLSYKNVPVVWIGGRDPELPPGIVAIAGGPKPMVEVIVEYLKGIGRKHIGFIGYPPNEVHHYHESVVVSMTKVGLSLEEQAYEPSGWGISPAARACQKLMKHSPNLDAIVASDDLQALGVLQTLREMGKKVPDDIAVVGGGNYLDEDGESSHLGLTTVDQNLVEQGRMAVECLVKMTNGEEVKPQIWVEPHLVRRQSA